MIHKKGSHRLVPVGFPSRVGKCRCGAGGGVRCPDPPSAVLEFIIRKVGLSSLGVSSFFFLITPLICFQTDKWMGSESIAAVRLLETTKHFKGLPR